MAMKYVYYNVIITDEFITAKMVKEFLNNVSV